MENGTGYPNVHATLAGNLPAEDCAKLNLGYLDPAIGNAGEWKVAKVKQMHKES